MGGDVIRICLPNLSVDVGVGLILSVGKYLCRSINDPLITLFLDFPVSLLYFAMIDMSITELWFKQEISHKIRNKSTNDLK